MAKENTSIEEMRRGKENGLAEKTVRIQITELLFFGSSIL